MNIITNFVDVECENFILEVKYQFRKGNAGDYYNPPEEDEIDIKRIYIEYYNTEEDNIININQRLFPLYNGNKLPSNWEKKIIQEIKYDLENFI
tara:strand:+ start:94 stop:375 length:282 start_codon:yes stop_codon:yes gene_type:complete